MLAFLKRDRLLQLGLGLFLLNAASYVYAHVHFPPGTEYVYEVDGERYVAQYWVWFDNAWYLVFLTFTLIGLFLPLRSRLRSSEVRFWSLIGGGVAAWWIYCILWFAYPNFLETAMGLTQADVLFLFYYLAIVIALDLRPDLDRRSEQLRLPFWTEVSGTSLFALGIMTYFVLIPYFRSRNIEYWSFVNSYYLYLAFDAYLVLRLIQLAVGSHTRRWRILYGILGASFAIEFVTNTLELLSYLPRDELHLSTLTGPVWFLPVSLLAFAGRLRLADLGAAAAPGEASQPARLVVFTFVVPLVHLLLYGVDLLDPASRQVRDLMVVVYLVAMGSLAQFQYANMRRRHRHAELEREEAVGALERSAREYRGLFENAHDAILIFQADGELILEANARACELYGIPRDQLLACSVEDLTEDPARERRLLGEALEKGTLHNLESVHRRADGAWIHVDINAAVVEYRGRPAVLLINRDITARKLGEQRLIHDALHDALTGLANRSLLVDRLRLCVERSRRSSRYHYAVLFLDLDRFKVINDSLGHLKGDLLLQQVARRLTECLRGMDTAARLGGDEFVALLEDLHDPSFGSRVAERVYKALARPFDLDGEEVFTSCSIGIAVGSAEYKTPEDVLRDADLAMYRAKEDPSIFYAVFDPEMHERAVSRLQLETSLRRSLENQELVLHYQPIVDLRSGEIAALEALVRWRHPSLGIVLPAEFLPVAEETGLIADIGRWVVSEACRDLAAWRSGHSTLAVSVNLSPLDLHQSDLCELIDRELRAASLEGAALHVEVTEGALIGSVELAAKALAELKRLEVRIHIDDFGTGYSSLSHLQRFPIDSLKVDRSFTMEMLGDEGKYEIVRTIVAMAHNMGMEVIVEGVESAEQAEALRRLGCEYGQGFFFAEPRPAHAIAALLAVRFRTA